jgi:HK97 family phage major capsid protein
VGVSLLSSLRVKRAALRKQLDDIEQRAVSEDRDLSEAELANSNEVGDQVAKLDERIASLVETAEREQAAAAVLARAEGVASITDVPSTPVGGAVVTSEEAAYHRDSDASWVLDMLALHPVPGFGGLAVDKPAAAERAERNEREMSDRLRKLGVALRETTTGSYAGMVPPVYAVDDFVSLLRAGRPTADRVRRLPLPPTGMVVIIPRVTAGSTVAVQATQNTSPTTSDMAFTDLSVPVISFSGRGVLSRQSIERAGAALDQITFADLAADAARFWDQQVLYGSGAGGNALGIENTAGIIAITLGTATAAALIAAVGNALQAVNTQLLAPADVIVMHPRRWGALTVAAAGDGRALVQVADANVSGMNSFGSGMAAAVQTVVGSLLGVPVITDPNIRTNLGAGTNEDSILVMRASEVFAWEPAQLLRQFTFEQPQGPQSVQLAGYGNAAFTAARRPTAIARITGAGLVPPTF